MKTKQLRLLALAFGIAVSAVTFTACDKDDDKGNPPSIVSLSVADDNETATVVFSEGVYKTDNQTGDLDKSAFSVSIAGGTAGLAGFTVNHTAGSNEAVLVLDLSGISNGKEVITVKAAGANAIFNVKGAAMDASESKTAELHDIGMIGKWQSSGANVAPILVNFSIDSIYAHFKGDNTYVVESYTVDGSKAILTGTFVQRRSSVDGIWEVRLEQQSPSALASEGIFQILNEDPLKMKYEVAQVDPAQPGVTPPTPEGGFGSTSNGAFGILNIQTYVKIK